MEAPALAFAKAGEMKSRGGKQLAQFGDKLTDFAVKKLQIADDAKATTAADNFELTINDAKDAALKIADPIAAEKQFDRDVKTAESIHGRGLTRRQQKSLFTDKISRRRVSTVLDFRKEINKRVVEMRTANLDKAETFAISKGADRTKSFAVRDDALREGINAIVAATADIGADKVQERIEAFTKSTVASTLLNMVNAEGADALGIISEFRKGNSPDEIIKSAQKLLTPEDVNKIADDALKQANRVVKARENARKAADAEANEANVQLYNLVVNADMSDPMQRELALEGHERLLAAGFYETPAKRNAVEDLLEISAASEKFVATPESDALQQTLEEKEILDQLTYEELIKAKGQVDPGFYSKMLQAIEGDRDAAEKEGIQIFRDAYDYTEKAEANLKTPSRMAFRRSSIEFREWLSKNKTKSTTEILDKARKIVKESQAEFIEKQRKFRQARLRASYGSFAPALKAKIPNPATASIEAVNQGLTKALLDSPGDALLLGFQKLINEEFSLQIFEPEGSN
tara:strand:- start:818 stop:2371 length:1554 start_codon:yes stop_codon:yes gene_type:complete